MKHNGDTGKKKYSISYPEKSRKAAQKRMIELSFTGDVGVYP